MTSAPASQTKGYLIAIVGLVFWSTTGVFIRALTETYAMPALSVALWRNVLVCAAVAPALLILRPALLRVEKSQLPFFVFYGFILSLFNSVWILSVKLNGAAVATVLGYGSAGFAAALAWLIFKESLGLTKIIAVGLSLFGCVLVAEAYDLNLWVSNPLGTVVGLLSGLVFAGYSLAGKEAANRNLNAWTALLYSFVFGSVFILLFNLFPALPGAAGSLSALVPRLSLNGWLLLLALSFIASTLGFGLYTLSMNYLPASVANLLATTEPVMTAILAYIFLGERMTTIQIVGSGIILLAVVILRAFGEGRD